MAEMLVPTTGHDTSEQEEEQFIAETQQFVHLLTEWHQKNRPSAIAPECITVVVPKRPQNGDSAQPGVEQRADAQPVAGAADQSGHNSAQVEAAAQLGRLLREHSEQYDHVLDQYFQPYEQNLWDMENQHLDEYLTAILNDADVRQHLTNELSKVVMVLRGFLHVVDILTAQHDTTHRVAMFTQHLGNIFANMGLRSWIRDQGGWEHILHEIPREGTPV